MVLKKMFIITLLSFLICSKNVYAMAPSSQLFDLPNDTLFEIFQCLTPNDLQNTLWTSHDSIAPIKEFMSFYHWQIFKISKVYSYDDNYDYYQLFYMRNIPRSIKITVKKWTHDRDVQNFS